MTATNFMVTYVSRSDLAAVHTAEKPYDAITKITGTLDPDDDAPLSITPTVELVVVNETKGAVGGLWPYFESGKTMVQPFVDDGNGKPQQPPSELIQMGSLLTTWIDAPPTDDLASVGSWRFDATGFLGGTGVVLPLRTTEPTKAVLVAGHSPYRPFPGLGLGHNYCYLEVFAEFGAPDLATFYENQIEDREQCKLMSKVVGSGDDTLSYLLRHQDPHANIFKLVLFLGTEPYPGSKAWAAEQKQKAADEAIDGMTEAEREARIRWLETHL